MSFDQIILMVALLAVAGILGWGVLTMARGGDYNIKNSNRIMRYRIIFQAIALIIILGLMWWQRMGHRPIFLPGRLIALKHKKLEQRKW